ncbi:hypothetical protein Nepgr_016906 [Nepenthes gracilis]|uniref:Uncharacterized protein n=1 Tax=Nepenthes gracilis TaxID=150966 RepID=A0AAD3SNG1_NEPGR|nr:hypothetical protein Nepgr_016906 [Nepenthes gracilis]
MRGSCARTNFVYSDMPLGSSVTSILPPDQSHPAVLPVSSSVSDHQRHSNPPPQQPFFSHNDVSPGDHFIAGEVVPPATSTGVFHHHIDDKSLFNYEYNGSSDSELPPLPDEVLGSGYEVGQGSWADPLIQLGLGRVTTGLDHEVGGSSGSYFDFESTAGYVHSPLFSSMPPVSNHPSSDPSLDPFNLGPSYFF